jgi:DNA-binding response OmpR family regulator
MRQCAGVSWAKVDLQGNTPFLASQGNSTLVWVQLASGVVPPCPTSADLQSPAEAGLFLPNLRAGFQAIQKIDIVHRQIWSHPGMSTKILIVDDDAELCDAFVEHLALHVEFESIVVETGAKGVQAAKAGQIDLIIMDVGLPDVDGREAVRILRKNGFKAPIIMLTGHDTDSDIILGLESGANDYVAKPFRFAVMLARIRAQLRQHEASEDAVFNVGPYTFRPGSKLLLNSNGKKVWLTVKETAILKHLYRAGQQPVSREVLLQELWAYNSGVTTHTLETHIYRLRQKVENDPANPAILVTESGGYKLVP